MKRRIMKIALIAAALGVITVVVLIVTTVGPVRRLAHENPRSTALMRERSVELGRPPEFHWVAYEDIPVSLRRAVLAGEDLGFFFHGAFDTLALRKALSENLRERRIVRGGSTISQQLAKNLFLSEARTPARKLREGVIALQLDGILEKRRILELYLNVIEWGHGVFGCAAAAQHHFGKDVRAITDAEALTLAAVIPVAGRCDPLSVCAPFLRQRERRIGAILHNSVLAPLLAPVTK